MLSVSVRMRSPRYVTRIAAACLCFVVAGVLYMTMSSTKMADNTGNADTAAPQMAYGITEDQEIQEEAVDAARSGDTAGTENEIQKEAAMAEEEAAMPEGEAAEDSANMADWRARYLSAVMKVHRTVQRRPQKRMEFLKRRKDNYRRK